MQRRSPYRVTETLYEGDGAVLYRAETADRVPVILEVLNVVTNLLSNAMKFGSGEPVEIEPGAGATFVVELPCAGPTEAAVGTTLQIPM